MNKISVILADDHAVVRMGFRLLLQDTKDITVVGEAESGEEVIKLLNTLRRRNCNGSLDAWNRRAGDNFSDCK